MANSSGDKHLHTLAPHATTRRPAMRCFAVLPVLLCLGAQCAGLDDAVGRESLSQNAAQENEVCRPRDAADVRAEAVRMLRGSGEYACGKDQPGMFVRSPSILWLLVESLVREVVMDPGPYEMLWLMFSFTRTHARTHARTHTHTHTHTHT